MKPDLLLICPLFPATMAQLDAAYEVHRYYEARDKEAFIAKISDRVTAAATAGHEGMPVALMSRFPGLKIISCFGVGVDGIDVPAARKLGIAVTNTPEVLTECVADNALALLLATMRRTVFNDKFVRAGNWLKSGAPLAEKVSGNRLGIIGLGRIGKAIAKRAEAFGMKVAYHSRNRQSGVAYDSLSFKSRRSAPSNFRARRRVRLHDVAVVLVELPRLQCQAARYDQHADVVECGGTRQ